MLYIVLGAILFTFLGFLIGYRIGHKKGYSNGSYDGAVSNCIEGNIFHMNQNINILRQLKYNGGDYDELIEQCEARIREMKGEKILRSVKNSD